MRILMLSAAETATGERVHDLAAGLAYAGHDADLIAPEQPSPASPAFSPNCERLRSS